MRNLRLFALLVLSFVTLQALLPVFADNKVGRTFTNGGTARTNLASIQNSQSDLIVYKRVVKRQQAKGFGRLHPALSEQAIALRTGKKLATTANGQLTVYGSMCGNATWESTGSHYGMYTFTTPTYSNTLVAEDEYLTANGGGVLVGDVYYCVYTYQFYGFTFAYLEKYNANTWENIGEKSVNKQSISTDMAYDPITEKVYGCFVNDYDNGYVWGTLNLADGSRTEIAPMSNVMIAIAASAEGIIYGIDSDANLYTINKETGEQTLVGATGLSISNITQSATFNLKTNQMYWAACLADGSTGLYSVDITTGKATLSTSFPDKEQYLGIFIKTPLAEDGAPAAVASVATNFQNGSSTGIVSFTAPTTTFAGEALSGNLTYTITANGKEVKTGSTTAGAEVNAEVTLEPGKNKIAVTTTNAEGRSPMTSTEIFVGKDAPTTVNDLKLEITDRNKGTLRLSWSAPTSTVNGGYLDTEALRYNVVRYPDSVVVANDLKKCEFTETISGESLKQYYYGVTPYTGELVGVSATSNKVKLGSHCMVPYVETFDNADALDNFNIIDGYDDGYTWAFRDGWNMIQSRYGYKNPMDEWLFTPPIYLETGKLYKLTFTASAKRVYPDRLEVKMGQGTSISDMTITLVKDTLFKTDEQIPDVVYDFDLDVKVNKTGDYNIGFHAMAEPEMSDLRLDDISLTEVSALACPDRCTDLTATAAPNGELKATITMTAPSKTVGGKDLQSIDKLEIYKGNKLLATIDNPEPGKQVTTTVDATQGNNDYTVYAYNEYGKGLDAKVSVYAGVSKPAGPTNVILKEVDSHAVITWDAPTVGEDGGYVDPSKMTYTILRGADQAVVASDITGNSFTDPDVVSGQTLQVYLVYANNAAGLSKPTYSNYIVVGEGRYTVPFKESFENAAITQLPWSNTSTGSSSWWLTRDNTNVKSQDGDNGMIYFQGEGAGETGSIFSGKISLKGALKPALVTYVYYTESMKSDIKLNIMATSDYINFTTLKTIDYNNFEGEEGWNKVVVPLDEFKNNDYVAVAYDAITGTGDYKHSIYIDNINVVDNLDNNITMTGFQGPASVLAGNTEDFSATWRNDGTTEVSDYSVELYQNGNMVDQYKGKSINPGEEMGYTFHFTANAAMPADNTFYAYINFAADQYKDNNKSKELSTKVSTVDYPTVSNLSGNCNGTNVELAWQAPVDHQAHKAITEGFETYEPFIIDNIGNWKLYDADGVETYQITYKGSTKQYLNSGAAMAWQVFNAKDAGLDTTAINYDIFMAHEGEQALGSFSSQGVASDNWIISPKLSGEAQVITFYVRTTIPNWGMETFEVLTSSSDNEVASFTKVDNIDGNAPYEWTKISFAVPQGTNYFAIRGTSNEKMLMLIDDITYIPAEGEIEAVKPIGYNIYRDGKKLNATPVKSTNYTDVVSDIEGSYAYQVSAVYAEGESATSAPLVIVPTAISNITANGVSIYAANHRINIAGATGKAIRVYTVNGAIIYSCKASKTNVSVAVAKGTYIVECDGNTRKITVR